MTRPLVCADGLRRVFDGGGLPALAGASLQLHEGEFVSLVGPSGCGKSTLLQLIGALDQPDAGELRWRGQRYAALPDLAAFRARRLGFVFQSFHLLPTLSALDNVQLPMFERAWSRAERRERAEALLADEPTGSLDSASAAQVLALLRSLHAARGLTLLVVTHDAEVAAQAARTLQMKDGRIVNDGTARGALDTRAARAG